MNAFPLHNGNEEHSFSSGSLEFQHNMLLKYRTVERKIIPDSYLLAVNRLKTFPILDNPVITDRVTRNWEKWWRFFFVSSSRSSSPNPNLCISFDNSRCFVLMSVLQSLFSWVQFYILLTSGTTAIHFRFFKTSFLRRKWLYIYMQMFWGFN